MMTYLKNMGGYKHSQLKGKSYEEIQGLYERQQKRIQDFTPMDSEKEAQKPGKRLKRVAGSYATQKSPKKPKVMKSAKDVTKEEAAEYEKEKEELSGEELPSEQGITKEYVNLQLEAEEEKTNGIVCLSERQIREPILYLDQWLLKEYDWCQDFYPSQILLEQPYLRERIPDISYFHVFGCLVFIHNHKDHLGKFDAKADDGNFLGYSSVSKAFRVYNTRRQQIEETYHVTFDESMEAIRFTNTLVDEIGIDDSSRYPPDEFQEDDPSRQYQVDLDVSYYIIPHGRSLTEITQENHVPEVIVPNEPEIPHTEDAEGPHDQINTEGTHEQNVQNDQMITQPTDVPSGNNTEVSGSITESLVPDVTPYLYKPLQVSHPVLMIGVKSQHN
ncbi:retrovirus-related pol polyprotein from transposon TNT 1-94 [Tanacetum coccineum]